MKAPVGQTSSHEPAEGDEPDKHWAARTRPGSAKNLVCNTKMRPMRAWTRADEPNESSLSMPPEGRKSSFRAGETTSLCITCCFAYAKPSLFFFAGPEAEPGQARPRHVGKNKMSNRAGKMICFFGNMLFRLRETSLYFCQTTG